MDIAAQIVAMRSEHGLTLRQLAAASGMSHARISKIEQRHIKPTFKDLVRLAKGLMASEEVIKEWIKELSLEISRAS